jgi:paraquat-inducible protein A
MTLPTATDLGLMACTVCGRLTRLPKAGLHCRCPHCSAALHPRAPGALGRAWAFLMAAMVLYVPSNLLVMMHSSDITGTRSDTIISGIAKLWTDGATGIATVVFVASVGVPLFKIAVMIWLLVSVQRRSASARRLRAGLFRVIERIGHWSMLDVFVVALLVALVDFNVARVEPGPAALAFGSVVILTMLAARSFDPRLIWDAPGPEASPGTSSSAPRYPASAHD